MHPLIEPLDAHRILQRGGVALDVQYDLMDKSWGPQRFADAHLPGACHVDLDEHLAAPVGDGSLGRHPLPDEDMFRAVVGSWGIGPETPVIVYDQGPGMWAARAWWLLRHLGHARVVVLNGGISAWTQAGLVTDQGPEGQPTNRGTYPKGFGAMPLVEMDAVQARSRGEAQGALVDSRAPERYRGDVEPIDPQAGHVPGASNLPFTNHLVDGRFPDEIVDRFKDLEDPIFYCGSGVTACHNVLAMEAAGYPTPKLWNGSWSMWSQPQYHNPVATGES